MVLNSTGNNPLVRYMDSRELRKCHWRDIKAGVVV